MMSKQPPITLGEATTGLCDAQKRLRDAEYADQQARSAASTAEHELRQARKDERRERFRILLVMNNVRDVEVLGNRLEAFGRASPAEQDTMLATAATQKPQP